MKSEEQLYNNPEKLIASHARILEFQEGLSIGLTVCSGFLIYFFHYLSLETFGALFRSWQESQTAKQLQNTDTKTGTGIDIKKYPDLHQPRAECVKTMVERVVLLTIIASIRYGCDSLGQPEEFLEITPYVKSVLFHLLLLFVTIDATKVFSAIMEYRKYLPQFAYISDTSHAQVEHLDKDDLVYIKIPTPKKKKPTKKNTTSHPEPLQYYIDPCNIRSNYLRYTQLLIRLEKLRGRDYTKKIPDFEQTLPAPLEQYWDQLTNRYGSRLPLTELKENILVAKLNFSLHLTIACTVLSGLYITENNEFAGEILNLFIITQLLNILALSSKLDDDDKPSWDKGSTDITMLRDIVLLFLFASATDIVNIIFNFEPDRLQLCLASFSAYLLHSSVVRVFFGGLLEKEVLEKELAKLVRILTIQELHDTKTLRSILRSIRKHPEFKSWYPNHRTSLAYLKTLAEYITFPKQ